MKKLFILVALFTTICITNASAQGQGGGDPAAMAARFKERMKPELVEKVKLTDAQADKVCDIQLASRQGMRGLRDLSEEDRKKKMDEMQADQQKQYKAIPLTDDQMKALNAFFEEQRKNAANRQGGNRPNN